MLRFVDGRSDAEAAELYGIPLTAFGVQVLRATRMLRRALESKGSAPLLPIAEAQPFAEERAEGGLLLSRASAPEPISAPNVEARAEIDHALVAEKFAQITADRGHGGGIGRAKVDEENGALGHARELVRESAGMSNGVRGKIVRHPVAKMQIAPRCADGLAVRDRAGVRHSPVPLVSLLCS